MRVLWLLPVVLLLVTACPAPTIVAPDAGVDAGTALVTCVDDEQCGGGFCRAGLCSADECEERGQCPDTEICKDNRCVAPPETCASPTDCPGDQLCDGFSDRCFDPNGPGEGEGEGEPGEGEGEGEVGEGEGEGEGVVVDLAGFRLENRESANPQATVFPAGTQLAPGQVLVVGRDASQADFVGFWGPLGAGARYLNAETDNGVPVINGREKFALLDVGGSVVDGTTRVGAEKKCYARVAQAVNPDASWSEEATTTATPGSVNAPGVSGLVITEWCDAEGTGNFVFEFIEIANLP